MVEEKADEAKGGDDSGVASAASTPEAAQTPSPQPAQPAPAPETAYTIRIVPPSSDPFNIQVNSAELVQEIHQVLLDREDTCHRSCFSLHLGGVALDNFMELRSVAGMKDGVEIRVVEEPYTVREARIHLRHLRDLLRSLDPADALNGHDGASLSFLSALTAPDKKGNDSPRRADILPPDFLLPGAKERFLTPLFPPFAPPHLPSDSAPHAKPPPDPAANGAVNGSGDKEAKEDAPPSFGAALKRLFISGWNPPPGNRRLHGDLMYVQAVTLEEKRLGITVCPRGWFINCSSGDSWDPRPAAPKHVYHSLVDLLSHVSPAFKRAFAVIQKRRCGRHILERLPTPYQHFAWAAVAETASWDAVRAEDASQSHKLGFEDHIPGQVRDWNEELQTTRELPRSTLPERLVRERAIFKIHSDFVSAAVKGAVAVVEGNVMAINPGDEAKMQMFIWNNIFFSLGFDVKDHYADLGGDAAAFVAPSNDLHGVRAYFGLDQDKLYTLGTVIVDYRGLRVTAQSIIPGILEREQEQSVVYGSIDFGKTVLACDKYAELMDGPAQALKIAPHKLASADGSVVTLFSSAETKGIVGNDGRHYILDLLRTFPPDINFLPGAPVSDVCASNGFPRPFPHKLACLRQELVDAFVEARYLTFIKIAAFHLQKLHVLNGDVRTDKADGKEPAEGEEGATAVVELSAAGKVVGREEEEERQAIADEVKRAIGTAEELEQSLGEEKELAAEEAQRILAATEAAAAKAKKAAKEAAKEAAEATTEAEMETAKAEIIAKAARVVHSLSDDEFKIRFNPDAFCPTVAHAESAEAVEGSRKLVQEACTFLLVSQIPQLVRDCLEQSLTPVDGQGLSEAMHARGLNVRYLGNILLYVQPIPRLAYLKQTLLVELLARSAKHVFRSWLQAVEPGATAVAVAHFLNCALGSQPAPAPPANLPSSDTLSLVRSAKAKAAKRRARKADSLDALSGKAVDAPEPWTALSPKALWDKLVAEARDYYGYPAFPASIDAFLDASAAHRLPVLRRLCRCLGVQVALREYAWDGKRVFGDEDILNLSPLVKHLSPRASDAAALLAQGQAAIQKGNIRLGYESLHECLGLLNSVYGAIHPEIAACLRLLARLAYLSGEHGEALNQQHKALLISERASGLDHHSTILDYSHLALYAFANLQVPTALRLLYRARFLLLLAHGDSHPHMALIDSNIGLVLHALQEFDLALKFLAHALALHRRFQGDESLKAAFAFHLMASAHSCRGDFRQALRLEKETFAIYRNLLGDAHPRTLHSGDALRTLTNQAVSFQKKMIQITSAAPDDLPPGSIASLLSPASTPLNSVLESLNIVNGIVFVPPALSLADAPLDATLPDSAVPDSAVPAPAVPAPAAAVEALPLD